MDYGIPARRTHILMILMMKLKTPGGHEDGFWSSDFLVGSSRIVECNIYLLLK